MPSRGLCDWGTNRSEILVVELEDTLIDMLVWFSGFGSSAIVHLATYQPPASTSTLRPEPILVAVKIIDIDRLPAVADIDRLRKSVQFFCIS